MGETKTVGQSVSDGDAGSSFKRHKALIAGGEGSEREGGGGLLLNAEKYAAIEHSSRELWGR